MYGNHTVTYYPVDFPVAEPEDLASLIPQITFIHDHELFQALPCLHKLFVFMVCSICFLVFEASVLLGSYLQKFYTPRYNMNCISENK